MLTEQYNKMVGFSDVMVKKMLMQYKDMLTVSYGKPRWCHFGYIRQQHCSYLVILFVLTKGL
jgi:hypothetical protein